MSLFSLYLFSNSDSLLTYMKWFIVSNQTNKLSIYFLNSFITLAVFLLFYRVKYSSLWLFISFFYIQSINNWPVEFSSSYIFFWMWFFHFPISLWLFPIFSNHSGPWYIDFWSPNCIFLWIQKKIVETFAA